MGLLDELEEEANRRRAIAGADSNDRAARELAWRSVTVPAMHSLAAYLKQLSQHLTSIERRERFVYPLEGYGEVTAEVDPNYRFHDEPRGNRHAIELEFGAITVTSACPVVAANGVSRVRMLTGLLGKRGLGGQIAPKQNDHGEVIEASFQARGRFPMKLEVVAEQQQDGVVFQFQNLDGFGNSQRRFRAEQLTAGLFDELGRFLARETLRFGAEELAEPVRQNLQSRLARENLKRDWEQRLDEQMPAAEARVRASMAAGGWLGKLLRLSRRAR